MRFLVDVCVDVGVREWLHGEGHDAVHLRDEGLQKLPNGQIFVKADEERRIIVTIDLDFGEILSLRAAVSSAQSFSGYATLARSRSSLV